jgi:hypothetical protein
MRCPCSMESNSRTDAQIPGSGAYWSTLLKYAVINLHAAFVEDSVAGKG